MPIKGLQTTLLESINDSYYFEPLGMHIAGIDITNVTELQNPSGATKLLLQALDTVNIRFTLGKDSSPTPTVGFEIIAGHHPVMIYFVPGTVIRIIGESVGASVQLQFGK